MDEDRHGAEQAPDDAMEPIRRQRAAAGQDDRPSGDAAATDVEMSGEGDTDAETRAEIDGEADLAVSGDDGGGAESDPTKDDPIFAMRADELVGRDVVDIEGEDIGDVENVVIGRADRTPYAIIEYGGFIGIGAKRVALPLDRLTVASDGSVLLLSGNSQEQLDRLPEYHEDEYGEIAENVRVRHVMMQ